MIETYYCIRKPNSRFFTLSAVVIRLSNFPVFLQTTRPTERTFSSSDSNNEIMEYIVSHTINDLFVLTWF